MSGSSIRFKRGQKSDLPSLAESGTPLWCEDSKELYVGTGTGVSKIGVVSNEADTTNTLYPIGICGDDNTALKRNTSVKIKGGTVTAQTFIGDFSGNATSATNDSNGNKIASTYLPKTGGTVTGTLDLTKNTDVSGTANNSPALRIGNITGEHLEFDGNEIHAKASGTTVGSLNLNVDGGDILFNGNKNKVSISGGKITTSTLQSGASKFTDAVTFANGIANVMGDDAKIGDFNKSGCIGIQSTTTITTGLSLIKQGTTWSSSSPHGSLLYNGENMYTDKCGLEKFFVKKVDLSNTTTYDPDTWYPVVGDIIPRSATNRCYMTRITLDVHLDSGTKPAWSTHAGGFTALYDVLQSPYYYGTSTDASSICLGRNFAWIKDSSTPPAIYRFLEHQSRPVFYLRGGGAYRLSTQYICNWQICTASTTFQDQSVAPATTCPGLMAHTHTIYGNITGLASKATADASGNNISSTYAKKSEYASLSIGMMIPCFCTSSYVPGNCLPVNGTEYTKSQFTSLWNNFLTTKKLLTCSYTEYADEISKTGKCAKFAIDTTNNKFKVPYIPDGTHIQQAMNDSELGLSYNAGLPNGTITLSNESGAVSASIASGSNTLESCYTKLSDFNSIFKDDVSTVQTESVALRWFVVVATGTLNQAQMDWTNWASSLQGKANTDLSNTSTNIDYVVESYTDGTSGYRIYRSGYKEQWGRALGQYQKVTTINFYKAFQDTNYIITPVIERYSSSDISRTDDCVLTIDAIAKESAGLYFYDAGANSYNTYFRWFAQGY